jgi:von Willebrand factor type A domain
VPSVHSPLAKMNPLFKHFLFCYLLIFGAIISPNAKLWGQNKTFIQPRILFLVDGSSSMLETWQTNQIRFKVAGKIIDQIVDSIYKVNPNVEFGLRVYGHQHTAQENNCFDTKLEVPFGKSNATQLYLRMASLKPLGVSPIAYSLKEAAENDLINTNNYNYSLILITDGGESCNGNICEVVKLLLEKKIKFQPYIISLINYQPLEQQYACLGSYLKVTNDAEATQATNTILEAYKPKFLVPELKTNSAEEYLTDLKASMNEIRPIDKITYFKVVITPAIKQVKFLTRLKPIVLKDTSKELEERKIDTVYLSKISSFTKLPYVHLSFENIVLKPYWLSTIKLLVPEAPAEIDTQEIAYIKRIIKIKLIEISNNKPTQQKGLAAKKITYTPEEEIENKRDTLDFIASKQLYYFYKQAKGPIGIVKTRLNTKPIIYKEEFSFTPDSLDELLSIRVRPIKFQSVFKVPNKAYTFINKKPNLYEADIEIEPSEIPFIKSIAARKFNNVLANTSPKPTALTSNKSISPYEASIEIEPSEIPFIKTVGPHAIYYPHSLAIPVTFYVKIWKLKPVIYNAEQEIESIAIDAISSKNSSPITVVKNNSTLKKYNPRFKPNPILKPTIDPTASLPDFKEQGNEAPFTSATQADTITSVAVLFTNGKGKFYKSTPQVLLKHPKTGEVLRKFYRTTDAKGNPDPQITEAGTYTLTITGQSNTVLKNVKVEEGKKNIITVVVGQGTLRFSYKNNPKRPVKEYQAIVNCRSDYSPTIYQQCAETLVYEPGNYYVEINTLPTLRKNVDFEFGVITDIYIPEPGTLQFTNSNNFGKVALLFQSGDRFMEFKQVRITGNLLTQKLELQPGAYQVLYYNSIGDRPKEMRIPFFIKSNETVELELK